jgi:PiT family inorganic phosphate transporter
VVDAVLGATVVVAIFIISARNRVDAKNALAGVNEVAQSGRVVKIKKVKPKKPRRKRETA